MPKLKQSAAEWCYFHGNCEAASVYPRLRQAGYAALEMVDESRWAQARSAGLAILNIAGPGMQDGLNRLENHATLLPAIGGLIAKAKGQGIAQVIVFSGSRKGQSDSEGIGNCARGLCQLCGAAEAAGVTLLFELLNSHDHADYHASSGRFVFDVVSKVGSTHVKALYDIYHAHRMGEDVTAMILNNLSLIGHLHVAGSPKRDFPGADQAIDYRNLVPKVMAAGYQGYWGQEFWCNEGAVEQYGRACTLFESYAQG